MKHYTQNTNVGKLHFLTDNKKIVKVTINLDTICLENSFGTIMPSYEELSAVAKCHPDDEFNLEKGEIIAVSKLQKKIVRKAKNCAIGW